MLAVVALLRRLLHLGAGGELARDRAREQLAVLHLLRPSRIRTRSRAVSFSLRLASTSHVDRRFHKDKFRETRSASHEWRTSNDRRGVATGMAPCASCTQSASASARMVRSAWSTAALRVVSASEMARRKSALTAHLLEAAVSKTRLGSYQTLGRTLTEIVRLVVNCFFSLHEHWHENDIFLIDARERDDVCTSASANRSAPGCRRRSIVDMSSPE